MHGTRLHTKTSMPGGTCCAVQGGGMPLYLQAL
jgi:hypothetical protein